jgi:TolB protein
VEVLGLKISYKEKRARVTIVFLLILLGGFILAWGNNKLKELGKKDSAVRATRVELSKVKIIDGIYPLGWLDEENIIVKKENKSKGIVEKDEGLKGYPTNIYKYNLKTGEENLLIESDQDIEYAVVSPNRKYIFYVEASELTGTGYIYNLANNKRVQVTEEQEIPIGIGRWADENSVIFFSYTKGGVFTASLTGHRIEIVPKAQVFMRDPIRVVDKVYYVSDQYKLYRYDTATKERKLLLDDIAEFIPSPKGLTFAHVALARKSIDIRDEKGEKKLHIYDGGGVGGFSWSPCGNKLAYLVSSSSQKGDTLFIAHISSGKSAKLAENLPQSFPYIFWSPSGKKILVPAYEKNDDKHKFIALIIESE